MNPKTILMVVRIAAVAVLLLNGSRAHGQANGGDPGFGISTQKIYLYPSNDARFDTANGTADVVVAGAVRVANSGLTHGIIVARLTVDVLKFDPNATTTTIDEDNVITVTNGAYVKIHSLQIDESLVGALTDLVDGVDRRVYLKCPPETLPLPAGAYNVVMTTTYYRPDASGGADEEEILFNRQDKHVFSVVVNGAWTGQSPNPAPGDLELPGK